MQKDEEERDEKIKVASTPVLSGRILMPDGNEVVIKCLAMPLEIYEELVALHVEQCVSEFKPLIAKIQNLGLIGSIKEIRTEFGCGLAEAKELLEYLESKGFWSRDRGDPNRSAPRKLPKVGFHQRSGV